MCTYTHSKFFQKICKTNADFFKQSEYRKKSILSSKVELIISELEILFQAFKNLILYHLSKIKS